MPDWKKEVRAAIARLHLDHAREESIAEELAEHLSEQYAELVRNGVSEEEARLRALEELDTGKLGAELEPLFRPERPPVAPGTEEGGGWLAGLGKDVRLGARLMRRNPGFAAVAIASLALGIGANAAIFQLIDAVALRTIAAAAPEQLANVLLVHGGRVGSSVSRQHEISSAIWEQLRQRQQAFSGMAAWSTERFDMGNGGEARYTDGLWVSGDFFETLEIRPAVGRLIAAGDDRRGCGAPGVVVSDSFWQSEFGGRADAVGKWVTLNRHSFPIIGVAPRGFLGLEVGRKFDVALPLCSEPLMHADAWTEGGTTWWLAVIGRLRPGMTVERATARLTSIAPGIFAATLPAGYDAIQRKDYLRFGLRAAPGATGVSNLRTEFEDPLWLLLGISGAVLLIACANIANMTLARAGARQREMALRMAIGASPARLVRQLMVESLLIAAAGAAAGGALAQILSRALAAGIGAGQERVFLSLSPDWRVLAFMAGLAVLTCVACGAAPAVRAANTDPGAAVKTGGRGLTGGRRSLRWGRMLVVAQVAASVALVATASLFVRTFENLAHLNAGFAQDHVLVAEFDLSPLKLAAGERREYKREIFEQVRATAGVISAADATIVPLSGSGWNEFIDIPGTAVQRKLVYFSEVSSDYFRTLAVPMLAGRDFNSADTPGAPPVAIVNEAFAKQLLGNGGAVGEFFGVRQEAGKPDKMYRIAGVVGNTKYMTLKEPYGPIAFVAGSQDAAPDADFTMVVRSDEDLARLVASLKAVAAKNSPAITLSFSVLRNSIRAGLGRENLMATLSGFYGMLAAMLAVIGIYGTMAYTVSRRTGEIGVRMALGATRGRILGMIVRDALTTLSVGLGIGALLAMAAGRAVQAMLFGLKPGDPVSLGLALGGMAAAGLAASLIPAQRAAAVQPVETLREE